MSILTNFLKLVKPEKNDYVDVEEHISNNLDKIDEKMENFNLNKLDKGGYTGTAQNLLTEISKIASKTVLGRMIVGKGLTVDSSGRTSVVSRNDGIIVNDNDIQLNVYDGVDSTSTTRAGSARQIKLLNENKQDKTDNTLNTTSKEIVGAINEINRYGFDGAGNGTLRIENPNPNNIKNTGLLYLANIADSEYKKLYPVDSADFYAIHLNYNVNAGALQIMQSARGGKVDLYTRVANVRPGVEQNEPIYTEWESILTSNNKLFLGNAGISKVTYIQDAGTKTINQGYIDKDTGKLYRAKETNTDVTVTSKFELADNISNSQKVSGRATTLYSGIVTLNQVITVPNLNQFSMLVFRDRQFKSSVLFKEEFMNKIPNIGGDSDYCNVQVSPIGNKADGYASISCNIISPTQIKVIQLASNNSAISPQNFLNIVGVI